MSEIEKLEARRKACIKYRAKNREKLRLKAINIYYKNKEKYSNNGKKWRANNPEKEKNRKKEYRLTNREIIKEKRRLKTKIKRSIDPGFRLKQNISRRIRQVLKINGSNKENSFIKYIFYSIDNLKQHLESQFEPWMNWNNYGVYNSKTWNDTDNSTWTWQIDHIIPQSKLPYSNMEDENFKKCWALENLRPYSAKQNYIDGARR